MVGLASALLALVFVINNFLIFGIDAPGVINTLRLGDVFGVDRPKQGYNLSQISAWHCSNRNCCARHCVYHMARTKTK